MEDIHRQLIQNYSKLDEIEQRMLEKINNNHNLLQGQSEHATSSKQSGTTKEEDSEPIADLFPDATVMFAGTYINVAFVCVGQLKMIMMTIIIILYVFPSKGY